ncbi:MAG TPA: Holliday junction branch migration protein RuvA [Planctomycetota bacterium]|nr:Holliday junction branch migration protein RuvA [Planctomycetota bacterium]
MIDRMTGTIVSRGATDVVLDVNGVGYRLEISLATSEALASRPHGTKATLLTHLHLVVNNEPSLKLFGFATDEERRLFKLLLPVKGVGPQTALRILSAGRTTEEVARSIASGDPKRIKAKGVGPKIAERVAIELKDKVGVLAVAAPTASGHHPRPAVADRASEDAFLALRGLEFDEDDARKLIDRARARLGGSASAEELVREGLRSAV